jgi:hypothetical protein
MMVEVTIKFLRIVSIEKLIKEKFYLNLRMEKEKQQPIYMMLKITCSMRSLMQMVIERLINMTKTADYLSLQQML